MNDQLTLLPDLSVAAVDRPAPASKAKALAPSYTGDRGAINAYSDYAAKRKEQFLHDGCAYLKDVGRRLAANLPHVEVHSNRAGIAVSGEV